MVERNIKKEFTLKNIDSTRNCFFKEIEHYQLMSKRHLKFSAIMNYTEYFLISASAITGCVSIFAFASFLDIPIGINSSAIGLQIFAVAQELKSISQLLGSTIK